ncbi:MAG: dihydrolipoyl dehydrogenase [Dehalococcoidales bacterium]|nr:MAG: dihydrolipoyl dehydrogenase [Dehalococcoidales bacterium]
MSNYDVVVIGSGCGTLISDEAASKGLKTALIDKGPLIGGTCLNLGCIPSKTLIFVADRILEIEESKKLGIDAEIKNIDFRAVMERMRKSRQESQVYIREGIKEQKNLDFYEGECQFVSDYTLDVNGNKLKGENIFIASGSRPFIPPIKGLENIDYLTNESALELKDRPDSLIIIGGGYIAVEYGHFFAAMGTRVTIIEMADRLVLSEEPEISGLLKSELSKRMAVYTNAQAEEVRKNRNGISVVIVDKKSGEESELTAQKIMMAVGRRSNADLLKVEATGVELDNRDFIKVNEYMETSKKNIYAVGDANGQQMFTHMANREAAIVAQNVFYGTRLKVDYTAVPHAVYSHPQIAVVGLKEEEAKKNHEIIVGRTKYFDIGKGEAMLEKEGYAKAIVEKGTDRILGCHIIGPSAPELIQEIVNAMTSGGHIEEINQGIHIHPALSELVPTTLNSLEES